jgi:hypothetical protein
LPFFRTAGYTVPRPASPDHAAAGEPFVTFFKKTSYPSVFNFVQDLKDLKAYLIGDIVCGLPPKKRIGSISIFEVEPYPGNKMARFPFHPFIKNEIIFAQGQNSPVYPFPLFRFFNVIRRVL